MANDKSVPVTVIHCSSKEEASQELVVGLLANHPYPMSAKQLTYCLVSDPYNLTFSEAAEAIGELLKSGRIRENNSVLVVS